MNVPDAHEPFGVNLSEALYSYVRSGARSEHGRFTSRLGSGFGRTTKHKPAHTPPTAAVGTAHIAGSRSVSDDVSAGLGVRITPVIVRLRDGPERRETPRPALCAAAPVARWHIAAPVRYFVASRSCSDPSLRGSRGVHSSRRALPSASPAWERCRLSRALRPAAPAHSPRAAFADGQRHYPGV